MVRTPVEDVTRGAREIVDEFCLGIGATEEIAEPFYMNPLPAVTNRELGAAAVIGASHMQFVIPRQVARRRVAVGRVVGHRPQADGLQGRAPGLLIDQGRVDHVLVKLDTVCTAKPLNDRPFTQDDRGCCQQFRK